MTAPDIPQSIKALRVDGYRNIFELVPNCPRLFGTETLCGDWDGEILIVAQDFSTTPEMVRRLRAGEQDPYHHDPKIPTNRNLVRLLQENGVQIDISGNGIRRFKSSATPRNSP